MAVLSPVAQVMNVDADQPGFGRSSDDAMPEGTVEEIGEDGEDVEDHLSGGG